MRFSITSVLAFAATALAQAADFDPIFTPVSGENVPAGAPYTVTWKAPAKYAAGTIKIELIGGATQNTQVKLADVASGIKNSAEKYTWNVDAGLGDKAVYGLIFRYESNPEVTFQYSQPFHIKASDKKPSGSGSVTLTKSHGVKTITLSSTSTPVTTSAPVVTKHETKVLNTTVPCNTTTTLKTTFSQSIPVVITSTAVVNPSVTVTTKLPTPTAAANSVRAGSLVILGVVAAVLAL